jgi:hypothetical protein
MLKAPVPRARRSCPFEALSCRPLPFPRPQSLGPISYDLQGGSVRNATVTWAAVASGLKCRGHPFFRGYGAS